MKTAWRFLEILLVTYPWINNFTPGDSCASPNYHPASSSTATWQRWRKTRTGTIPRSGSDNLLGVRIHAVFHWDLDAICNQKGATLPLASQLNYAPMAEGVSMIAELLLLTVSGLPLLVGTRLLEDAVGFFTVCSQGFVDFGAAAGHHLKPVVMILLAVVPTLFALLQFLMRTWLGRYQMVLYLRLGRYLVQPRLVPAVNSDS